MTEEREKMIEDVQALQKACYRKSDLCEERERISRRIQYDFEKRIQEHKKKMPKHPAKKNEQPLIPKIHPAVACLGTALTVGVISIIICMIAFIKNRISAPADSASLEGVFVAFGLIAIVCAVVAVVCRGAFGDLPGLVIELLDIPNIKRQNQQVRQYNETEYVACLKQYEADKNAYGEELRALEQEQEKALEEALAPTREELEALEREETRLREALAIYDEYPNFERIKSYLKSGQAATVAAAVELARQELEQLAEELEMEYLREKWEREEREQKASDAAFEETWAARDRAQKEEEYSRRERDRAEKEREERRKQQEWDRWESDRRERAEHQQQREDRRAQDRGLRMQCNSCKNASSCYMRGSYPCPSYRPR